MPPATDTSPIRLDRHGEPGCPVHKAPPARQPKANEPIEEAHGDMDALSARIMGSDDYDEDYYEDDDEDEDEDEY